MYLYVYTLKEGYSSATQLLRTRRASVGWFSVTVSRQNLCKTWIWESIRHACFAVLLGVVFKTCSQHIASRCVSARFVRYRVGNCACRSSQTCGSFQNIRGPNIDSKWKSSYYKDTHKQDLQIINTARQGLIQISRAKQPYGSWPKLRLLNLGRDP